MPSSEKDRTERVPRTVDPATAPVDDLLAHLATDPRTGLSPKEAARRQESSDARPLFRRAPRTMGQCLQRSLREPALWLLLVVAFISLFFERIALGLFCLLLTAGHTALCAYFLYRSDRVDGAMQVAYDTPLCRVLRGGRLLRMSAEGLVPGDILLLSAGDIVSADCRLIRTEGFAVTERELDATESRPTPVYLRKDAAAVPDAAERLRVSPANMVYAGGMVEAGSALAVVVAVGSETHLGGLKGYIASPHQNKSVSCFKGAARVLSIYNLCLFCLTVPLTVVGIFTVGDAYEFLDIFLSALALASVTLTEHSLCKGIHLAASARRSAALDRDRENTADVKSAAALEKLGAMTDLLLVGTAALHDGIHHPECLYVGDQIYRCDRPDADETARVAAEYLWLYRKGMESLPALADGGVAYSDLAETFCRWAEMDTQAFELKVKEIRTERGGASGVFPTPQGSHRVTVLLEESFDRVESCTHVFDGRMNRPLDRERLNGLYRLYREAARQGSIPLFLLTECDGERTVYAMLTYAPGICRKTAGCVKNLESAGIRVTAFLRDVSDSHTRTLAACGLTDRAPADRPAPEGERVPAAQRMDEGCRAFEVCSEEYVLDCVARLKAEGRTVGVLAVEARDISILAEADIAFTCAPSLYESAEAGVACLDPHDRTEECDGLPDGRIANDRFRHIAHVTVRRSSSVGGGILGVLRALQAADSFRTALHRTLRFTLLSQAVRLVMTVLPLCLGLSVAAAPTLLLSGLFLDLLVMAAASRLPLETAPLSRCDLGESIARPHITYRTELISAAIGAAVPWVIAGIAALCGVEFGGDLVYYGLLGTLGLQIAIFLTAALPRRDSTVFLAALCLMLVYVGALAASLVSGLQLLWVLILPLTAPLMYVILRGILNRVIAPSAANSRRAV